MLDICPRILRSWKTVRFSEQIMSADKYSSILSLQMEDIARFTYIIYGVILGVHLFTLLFPVCLSLFYVSLINVNSLLFTQSPCEYNPCKNGAPCLPLYRSNSYLCMLRPGKIEQGRINIELQIYKKLILFLCVQT